MKKILLSFFMCMLAIIGMQAAEVTLSKDDATGKGTSGSGSSFTIEKSPITFAFDKAYGASESIRSYASSNIIISGATETIITQIVLTTTDGKNGTWGDNVVTSNSTTHTWTGNANSVTLSTTKQARITSIVVTYEGGGEFIDIVEPTFTPKSGTEFEESQEVTITNNADGATVYYSLNGGEFEEYTAPFTVTETTTVDAYAQDLEGNKSNVVSAKYTKSEPLPANTIVFNNEDGNNDSSTAATIDNFISNLIKKTNVEGLTCTATSKCYKGKAGNGIKMGTSSADGSFTLQLASAMNVESIVVNAVEYDGDEALLSVNGSDAQSLTAEFANYTFEINKEINEIAVNMTERGYIKSLTINVANGETPGEDPETPVDPTPDPEEPVYGWVLVKDASTLAVGDKVVIVATDSDVALSTTQNTNNRGQAAVTKNGETITFGNDVQVLTLEAGNVADTWAFNTGSGYLYAASSSSNHLKTKTTKDENGSWDITIANDGVATVVAQGTNTRNLMQYNETSTLFSCYEQDKKQLPISLYRYCDANITAGMYYLVPGEWENEDLALYGVKFINVSTGENKWVQGFLNNHYVYFQLDGEGKYTHMAFYRIANTGNTTVTVITDWDAIEELDKTPLLTYTAPGAGNIMRYNVDESKWEEVEIGTGVNRVELAGGIGYAYGVVSAEGAIEVYNVNGAVVARGNDNVDLRGLGRGVYIIRNGNQVRKVVR